MRSNVNAAEFVGMVIINISISKLVFLRGEKKKNLASPASTNMFDFVQMIFCWNSVHNYCLTQYKSKILERCINYNTPFNVDDPEKLQVNGNIKRTWKLPKLLLKLPLPSFSTKHHRSKIRMKSFYLSCYHTTFVNAK